MPIIIPAHKAKTHFSRLLDQAHEGQELILAKASKRLRAAGANGNCGWPEASWTAWGQPSDSFFDPLPAEDVDAWVRR